MNYRSSLDSVLREMNDNAARGSGKVSLVELFPPAFMRARTRCRTLDAMLEDAARANNKESATLVSSPEWDAQAQRFTSRRLAG